MPRTQKLEYTGNVHTGLKEAFLFEEKYHLRRMELDHEITDCSGTIDMHRASFLVPSRECVWSA